MLHSNAESDTLKNRLYLTLDIGEEPFEKYTFFRVAKDERQSGNQLKLLNVF